MTNIPIDLADRIECYLNDHPGDGGHSDAAGGDAWELLDEAKWELRSMVPKRLLDERDAFIVSKGLWLEFMDSLPTERSCSDRLPQCVHEKCDDPEWCAGESKCRYGGT